MKATLKIMTVAAVVALLATACGDDTNTTTSTSGPSVTVPTTAAPAGLAGSRWVATGILVGGAPVPIVPDSDPTLDFDADGRTFGGTTGCNHFGGDYTVGADGSIMFGAMAMTEMACEEPLMAQENTVIAIFQEATFYSVDGGVLTIGRLGGSSMEFVDRAVAFPGAELTGTQWIADTLIQGDSATTTVAGSDITLFIDAAASQARGSTGCNDYGASVEATPTQLTFGTLTMTERACLEPGVMEQEAFVLAVFQGELTVDIDGDRLTLLTPDGDGLSFSAAG